MKYQSIWKTNQPDTQLYPGLEADTQTEVAIIGGGITGLSAGYFLARQGVKVVVLEAEYIGSGTTGSSTGNLYVTIDEMYHQVMDKFDRETARILAESRQAGMDAIDDIIREHNIECNYIQTTWNLLAETKEVVEKLKKEYDAFADLGIAATFHRDSDILPQVEACLEVPAQAQLDPKTYMAGLAKAAAAAGCVIHEKTRAKEMKEEKQGMVISTTRGRVHAQYVINATHSPKGEKLITTLLGSYREYVVAAKVKEPFPRGIYWSQQKDHHYSLRTATDGSGETYLMCLGEPHKVGQDSDNDERLKRIETYMRSRFNVGEVQYFWGAQHYKSADKIPYIGTFGNERVFLATGYSTDGLVYGTVAGLLICDLIQRTDNPWSEVYKPGRVNPMKSAGRFIKENVNVMGELIKDKIPFIADTAELKDVPQTEGQVVEIEGSKYAAYRDELGKLHIVSAVCPHMGCIVHWNKSERSWDCPCHGSRFTTEGKCIEGPSFNDLAKMSDK